MKRALWLALWAAPLLATYTYFQTDNFATINTTYWTKTNNPQGGPNGLFGTGMVVLQSGGA